MKKIILSFLMLALTSFAFGQTTVTKSYTGPTITVDGCGTFCSTLPGLVFDATDFPAGCEITDVNVSIVWLKTDGSCAAPGTGNSFHGETSFRLDGPTGNQVILANPGTWSGATSSPPVLTVFDQAAVGTPSGTPVSGTFLPNNGNLDTFNSTDVFGTWFLRAGDNAGADPLCIDSFSITITVADDITPPAITCPANITQDNDPGVCGAVVTWAAPVGTDNCSGATTTSTHNPGDTFPVGTTTVTYTVTDGAGLMAMCSFDVTVNDTENPVVTCPGDITVANDAGLCSAQVSYALPTIADNCPSTALPIPGFTVLGTNAGSHFYVSNGSFNGPNAFLDATANGGNVATISDAAENTFLRNAANGAGFTGVLYIGLNDITTEGTFVWQNGEPVNYTNWGGGEPNNAGNEDYTQLRTDGAWNDIFSTSSSNYILEIPFITQTAGLPSGSTFPVGTTTNTFVATDGAGNTATCSFNVTVNDTEAPVATCPADITVSNDAGQCSAVVTFAPTATDNCAGVTVASVPASGSVFPVGTTLVTTTATDAAGNTATCTFNVTVNDTENPVIACPGNITQDNDPGACGAVVTWTAPVGTDNCAGATTTSTHNPGDTFPVGTTAVTYTVTDASGNTAQCSFDVTVNDAENPVITCPADITVDNDPGVCGAVVTFAPTATDNCPGVTVSNVPASGSVFPVGTTLVTSTTTDASGNTAICTFNVTVNDTEPPVVACQDITVQLDASGMATIPFNSASGALKITEADPNSPDTLEIQSFAANSVDYSGYVVAISDSYTDINVFNSTLWNLGVLGSNEVAYRTDGAVNPWGSNMFWNSSSPSWAMIIDDAGNVVDAIFWGWDEASILAFNPTINGFPITMTTADWSGNGVNVTCTQSRVRQGTSDTNTAADWSCIPTTIGIANPGLTITPSSGNFAVIASVSDNCGIDTISVTPTDFDCSNIGPNTVTVTVTDVNGNVSTCTSIVTVEDNIPPVAVCMDITVQLDANGMASIVPADIDGGSTDNCAITLDASQTDFTCADVGANNITLTVTDQGGNVSTCIAVVTVEDNVPPVAVCQNIDAFLDANGTVTITAADVDGGSTDACGIASLAIDIDTFTCDADLGPNDVTLTVTDNNGNVSTCVAVVTVIDAIDPIIACPPSQTANTDPGLCSAVVVFPDAIALDNCTVTVAQTGGLASGSAFPVGVSTIEYTATDSSGNTAVCTFTITVTDNELPVAVCQDITIQLDANGDASITAADIDGGSSDNCGIASLDASQTDFDCSDVGPNDITLTVTDVNGNVSTCIAVVTVEDNVDPVAVCMNITVELDVNGTVTITPADIDAGSSDACGIASLELDVDTFTCADVGDNTVTLTVTDNNGNVSTCTAIVTVEDNIDPDLVCMDITVELDENGEAMIVPEDVIMSNTDACGILVTGIDIFEFDCSDIGTPVTVTVFSQDNNGNLSSCTAVVTVVDALAPVVTCPADITVDPGAGNQFYEVPDYFALGEATATDNCTDPLTIFGQDPAPGTLLPDGVYTVTMSAEDESGNVGTCTFELTIESILGVNDNGIDISTIVMYPNPAINVVNISNPQNIELEQAAIYDVTGRLVQTYDLKDMGTEKTLDISMLSSATYVVLIQGAQGQVTKQLIKE